MSNRTEAEVTFAAELKAGHLAQIEALTAPGLTREERIWRFMNAARFHGVERTIMSIGLETHPNATAAYFCWSIGTPLYSLFAHLPGCACPVIEVRTGHAQFDGIPRAIPKDWSPTAAELLPFARVQQERRIK
jgi:hypothetical protein